MKDLGRKMASGAAWMIFVRATTRGLGFVSTIILARLLTPADFGLVALATAIIAALELMGAFSFDVPLIQKQHQSRELYDTAWTITIIFSLIVAAILAVLAYPAARFFGEPPLQPIMYVLAFGTIIEGFQNIGVVAFRKDMNFRQEFMFQVAKKIVSFAVTVPLAFWLRNYWALAAGIVAGKLCGTALSFAWQSYRPRWCTAAWAELFQFSRWLFFNNLLYFLRSRSSDFIVGKIAGPAALGMFSLSLEFSQMPSTELVAPINRAVFPAYARISGDLARLQQSYLDVVGMIALLAMPAAIGIAVTADLLVDLILGPKWIEAAPLIRILGFAGMISALETNIGAAYLALGRPEILTKLYGFYAGLLIFMLVIFTSRWGLTGAAWACLIAAVLNIPVYFGAMLRTLKLPIGSFVAVIWRPIAASLIMYAVVFALLENADSWGLHAQPLKLLCSVLSGASIYIAVVVVLWYVAGLPTGAETAVMGRIAEGLKRGGEEQPRIT